MRPAAFSGLRLPLLKMGERVQTSTPQIYSLALLRHRVAQQNSTPKRNTGGRAVPFFIPDTIKPMSRGIQQLHHPVSPISVGRRPVSQPQPGGGLQADQLGGARLHLGPPPQAEFDSLLWVL